MIDIEINKNTKIKIDEDALNKLQKLRLLDVKREELINNLLLERSCFTSNIFKTIYTKYPELEKYNLKYDFIDGEGYITILSKKIEKIDE